MTGVFTPMNLHGIPSSFKSTCMSQTAPIVFRFSQSPYHFSSCQSHNDFLAVGGYSTSGDPNDLILGAIGHSSIIFNYVSPEGQSIAHNGLYWYRYCCAFGYSASPSLNIYYTDKETSQGDQRLSWDIDTDYYGLRLGNFIIDQGGYVNIIYRLNYRTNCANYDPNTGCQQCSEGFFYGKYKMCYCKYNFTQRCLSCSGPQASWSSEGHCQCSAGYFYSREINSNDCTQCNHRCQECQGSATNCTQCRYPATSTLVNGTCKCNERYLDNGSMSSVYCIACHYTCFACQTTSTYCIACSDPNSQLINNKCICNKGYYDKGSGQVFCMPCNNNCGECVDISTKCTSCNATYSHLKNNVCVCDGGYFSSGPEKEFCFPCDENCGECINIATRCTKCNSTHAHVSPTNVCVCDGGYYKSGEDVNFCFRCDNNCGECLGEATNCTFCNSTFSHLVNNYCKCDGGYYMSGASPNFCFACDNNCGECVDISTKCTFCNDTHSHLDNHACVCDGGYFSSGSGKEFCFRCDNNCGECIDIATKCTFCNSTFSHLTNNYCDCDGGYYMSGDEPNFCFRCDNNCGECIDTATKCTKCNSTFSHLANNYCECDGGYYMSGDDPNFCFRCDNNCGECIDTATNCTSCNSTFSHLSNNYCECDGGYYMSGDDPNFCFLCDNNCGECVEISTNCTYCNDTHAHVENYRCVCDGGYYEKGVEKTFCFACDDNCGECLDTPKYCITCNDTNSFLAENQCKCSPGFYDLKSGKNFCAGCDNNCRTCVDAATKCLSCGDPNSYFQNYACHCRDRYFRRGAEKTFCFLCDSYCGNCVTSESNCVTCRDSNSQLANNRCLCKPRYFDAVQNKTQNFTNFCESCLYKCSTCTSLLSCTACLGQGRIFDEGRCTCADGFYDDFQNPNCQVCNYICATCDNPTSCLTCSNTLRIPPDCPCKAGFYEIQGLRPCYPCLQHCRTCNDSDSCLTCRGENRNVSNKCFCDQGYYQNKTDLLCYFCDLKCQEGFIQHTYIYMRVKIDTIVIQFLFTQEVDRSPKITSEIFNINFSKLTPDQYEVSFAYDELKDNAINIYFKFSVSFPSEKLVMGLRTVNNIKSAYEQDLNNTFYQQYVIPIDSVVLGKKQTQMEERAQVLQMITEFIEQSSSFRTIKYMNLIDMFVNTQAITNLLLPNFQLPLDSYEFVRIVGMMTYPRIPTWAIRTQRNIFNETYKLSPMIVSIGVSESLVNQTKPTVELFEQMRYSQNFLLNSFNFYFTYSLVAGAYLMLDYIYSRKLREAPSSKKVLDKSPLKIVQNFSFGQLFKQLEAWIGRLVIFLVIQIEYLGSDIQVNIWGLVVAVLTFLGVMRFLQYISQQIISQDNFSFNRSIEVLGKFSTILGDIDYHRGIQKFDLDQLTPMYYYKKIYQYKALYHIFGMLKKILVTALVVVLRKQEKTLIISLISIQSFVLVLTILFRPLIYWFQNITKIVQEIVLLAVYIQTFMVYKSYLEIFENFNYLSIEVYERQAFILNIIVYVYLSLLVLSFLFSLMYLIVELRFNRQNAQKIEQLEKEEDLRQRSRIAITNQNALNQESSLSLQRALNTTQQDCQLRLFNGLSLSLDEIKDARERQHIGEIVSKKLQFPWSLMIKSLETKQPVEYDLNPYNQVFQILNQGEKTQLNFNQSSVSFRKVLLSEESFRKLVIFNSSKYYHRLVSNILFEENGYRNLKIYSDQQQIWQTSSSKIILGYLHLHKSNLRDFHPEATLTSLQEIYLKSQQLLLRIKFEVNESLVLRLQHPFYNPNNYTPIIEDNFLFYSQSNWVLEKKTQLHKAYLEEFLRLQATILERTQERLSFDYLMIEYSIDASEIIKNTQLKYVEEYKRENFGGQIQQEIVVFWKNDEILNISQLKNMDVENSPTKKKQVLEF